MDSKRAPDRKNHRHSRRADLPPAQRSTAAGTGRNRKLWIDLDNTPHVPFFRPIIRELEARGFEVVVTARDAFQVRELAERLQLEVRTIGAHYGKNPLWKAWGLARRSMQLLPCALRERPLIGLSHGARSQLLLCNVLRIPTVMVADYEHVRTPGLVRPRWEIVPEALANEALHCRNAGHVRTYRGIKEEVYASEFIPDHGLPAELRLRAQDVIVAVRPPATEAHYHNPESDTLFVHLMERICRTHGVTAVLLPRNRAQEAELRASFPSWFVDRRVVVPDRAVDGLNLVWHSDLVVSGGGTMNREAAALGVPVYSLFRGRSGAVDRQLEAEGRLRFLTSVDDVQRSVRLERRDKSRPTTWTGNRVLLEIVHHVEEIVRLEYPAVAAQLPTERTAG
jgi:uncharacterized protein